jgi:hypothetical protein
MVLADDLHRPGGEGEGEEEKDATLKYVLHDLAPELVIELMEGFHRYKGSSNVP